MSYIKKSREELQRLGIKTTYVVAGRTDGQFCILDANPAFSNYSTAPKPAKLPLAGTIYQSYQVAFSAILSATQPNQRLHSDRTSNVFTAVGFSS